MRSPMTRAGCHSSLDTVAAQLVLSSSPAAADPELEAEDESEAAGDEQEPSTNRTQTSSPAASCPRPSTDGTDTRSGSVPTERVGTGIIPVACDNCSADCRLGGSNETSPGKSRDSKLGSGPPACSAAASSLLRRYRSRLLRSARMYLRTPSFVLAASAPSRALPLAATAASCTAAGERHIAGGGR